jgi:hypothetical protein
MKIRDFIAGGAACGDKRGFLAGLAAYSPSQSLFEQVDFRSSLEVADPLCRLLIRRRMG